MKSLYCGCFVFDAAGSSLKCFVLSSCCVFSGCVPAHHRFIAEEAAAAGAKCVLTPSPTWIVDPIDGTCNFVHR